MTKHALITGAQGFVGRHMAWYLARHSWTVDAIDVYHHDLALPMRGIVEHMRMETRRYDLVVHAAARGPNRLAIDTEHGNFPYNVMLDAMMFDWAIRTKQHRFVYLSSSAAYPVQYQLGNSTQRLREDFIGMYAQEPDSTYGWAKLTGERMAEAARATGLAVTVVRPFSGYGEDQSVDFPFAAFAQRARSRQDPFIIWGNADQVRDWIHIDDVVRGIMAVTASMTEQPVNLCTGVGTSMRYLAEMMRRRVGYDPVFTVDADAPLGVMHRVGHPERMHKIFTPSVTIEEGVRRALKE